MMPNFLFIGPSKSASTWIFEVLRSHPQIFVPPCKDIYFFDRFYDKGLNWYSSHFPSFSEKPVVGEISHDYLFSETACVRIKKDLPGVKLITCLRNPVDRLFSEYLFRRKHGLVSGDIFESLKSYPDILDQSFYFRPIKNYVTQFGMEHLLILDFEEIKKDPDNVSEIIYRFLGVDPTFRAPIAKEVVLPASFARNRTLAFMSKKMAETLRNMGFSNLVGHLKRSHFINRLLYKEYIEENYPRLSPEDRMKIYHIFKDDIVFLENFLNVRFDSWHPKSLNSKEEALLQNTEPAC